MKTIEILNYEGPVLSLSKEDGQFIAIDQWKTPIAKMTQLGVCAFLYGDITLVDSKGKAWNYPNEHKDAKASIADILTFTSE
jgi:hypothetical protein